MPQTQETGSSITVSGDIIYLQGDIDKYNVPHLYKQYYKLKDLSEVEQVDLSEAGLLDSAGSIFIEQIAIDIKQANNLDKPYTELITNYNDDQGHTLKIFSRAKLEEPKHLDPETFFEKIGSTVIDFGRSLFEAMVLAADIFYWAIAGIWRRKGARKGSFIQQSLLIGLEGVPIVAVLSLIIGFILALQAAAQLRMFGADIFIADMLGYAMLTEMGALITAIIVSGRSGSSIASEIATMKVSEELDALKMMSINPIRYVIVPKFYAMTACMPLLVVMSIIIGIFGGMLIAIFYLNLSPSAFYNQLVNVLTFKDFVTTMIKSTFFGWAIVVIGSFYGLQVQGGAEGVGKATTYSVVTSIFTVILIDVVFSLLYLP